MQNVLKKNWIKENLSKVIISLALAMAIVGGIGLAENKVSAAYTPAPANQLAISLSGNTITPSGSYYSNPGQRTWYYLYEKGYLNPSEITPNTQVSNSRMLEKYEESAIRALNLNDYTWADNTVYTIYLVCSIWDDVPLVISNPIYYVKNRTVTNVPADTLGYSHKLSDVVNARLNISVSGNILNFYGNEVSGDLKIAYYSGADNIFSPIILREVDGRDVNFSIDLRYLSLADYTAYKVYFEGVYWFDGTPVRSSEYVYSYTPMTAYPETPTKEGYTFKGWYYDAEFTRPYVQGTPIFEDTTLYAKFEINRYTVTYILNGNTYKTDTVDWNTAAQNYSLTQEGYTFSGWHTDSACTVDYNFDSTVKSNLTLYAKQIINTYTVTFNPAGGTVTSGNAVQTVNYGGYATAPTVTRTGYTFAGWDKQFNNITGDLTVSALWTINTYTVTFNANGGTVTGGETTQTIEYGSPATAPTLSRTGYNFVGWDKAFDNITGDTTITAQWEIIRFTVTFVVDGVVYDTVTVDYGTMFFENDSVQEIMKTLSAVYSDTEKTTLFAPATALNEDMTLYADINASLRDWLDFALWMQKNWIWITVCAGVLIAVIVGVIIKVKRG